jgi:selenocysteine lyase/cysteine desulfurase
MGLMDRGGVLRVGLAHYNTTEEVDSLLASLARQVKG